MPLLRYFIVVGSALIGLLYVVNAVLPDNTPRHVSSNIDGITSNNLERNPPARQLQHPAPVIAPAPEPDMTSSAAVPAVASPAGAEESPQKSNTPSAPVAEGPPPNKKRNQFARKREWRDDFRRDRGWRDRDWRDRGWRGRGSRDPYWGNWGWR
jgi:hypothetical protein